MSKKSSGRTPKQPASGKKSVTGSGGKFTQRGSVQGQGKPPKNPPPSSNAKKG